MSGDSTRGDLFDDERTHQRRKFFRFDPTVNSGTIGQIVTLLILAAGAWATYQSDKATARMEMDNVKLQVDKDRESSKEAVRDLRMDIKDMQQTLNAVNLQVTKLNARSEAGGVNGLPHR